MTNYLGVRFVYQSNFRRLEKSAQAAPLLFTNFVFDHVDLPNSDDVSYIDGMGYIVETNQNGKYRIYFYSNPNLQKTEEANRMMKIGEIIADEFGLHNFKVRSLYLGK